MANHLVTIDAGNGYVRIIHLPQSATDKPLSDDENIMLGQHIELKTLRQRLAEVEAAITWTREVYPSTNAESGGAIVNMTWGQFNAMRVIAGGQPHKPRKAKSAVVGVEHIAELEAKLALAEQDARRYRWLRDPPLIHPLPAWIAGKGNQFIESDWLTGEQADTAIDAAIASQGEGK